jgi:hypothetical protein
MESKLSGRVIVILGMIESQLLAFHLDDIFEVVSDFPIIEGSHSDHDLDAIVSHEPLR